MKPNPRSLLLASIAAAALLHGGPAAATAVSVGGWTPLFQGVDLATATLAGSVASAARVDLTAPGIGFTTTPASGPLETTAQTTSQFLLSSGAQVAINADFFDPCCNAAPEPKNLEGLAISNGSLVSPPSYGSAAGAAVLLITQGNTATIGTLDSPGTVSLAGVSNAVSGSGEIVTAGANTASRNPPGVGDPGGINPRTDVGVSADGRYLYLAVIDGRQPGYSLGVTDSDAADLMLALGSSDALNLDGGGSSALVRADGGGGAVVINRPSGGAERYDGNNLGVFAAPLPVPEPGSAGLVGVAALCLLFVRRRVAR